MHNFKLKFGDDLSQDPDTLIDATQNELTDWDTETLLEKVEKEKLNKYKMKRIQFLKNLFQIGLVTTVSPLLLATKTTLDTKVGGEKYRFDEVFYRLDTNPRLIYPKIDSPFYSKIFNTIKDSVTDSITTYFPIHQLSIPVKEEYHEDELKPILFYFESTKYLRNKFSKEFNVIFRMIQDTPEKMYLEVFLNYY